MATFSKVSSRENLKGYTIFMDEIKYEFKNLTHFKFSSSSSLNLVSWG